MAKGMRLDVLLKKRAAERYAQALAEALKVVCGIHAPMVNGRPTKATPGAPPRRVTSRLWNSIRAYGSRVLIHAPYAKPLEGDNMNHKFLARAKRIVQRTIKGGMTRRVR